MTPANQKLFAHLARALARYVPEMRRDGYAVPPELLMLAEFFTDCATLRQGATPVSDSTADPQGAGMTTNLLLSKREAAAALRVSVRTLERLIARGALPAVRVEGGTRIRRGDLEAYVAHLAPGTFRDDVTRKASA